MARIELTREEIVLREAEITAANRQHDAKYGIAYDKCTWRSGFDVASPKLDRESIWLWHRARETVLPGVMP